MSANEFLDIHGTSWQLCVVIGAVAGCRPSPNLDHVAEAIEHHDRVTITDEDWPFYLWTSIRRVDDAYAACLAGALSSAEEMVGQARTGSDIFISSRMTISLATPRNIHDIEKVKNMLELGGVSVAFLIVNGTPKVRLERE